ncbi:MAG: hypothetical protein COZ37_07270 [bacterium (Candidatus Ratteibacteria) CG_4_10_14_3_um_filter_41_18]|uniref:Uncharacterized protein n=3 Tax=Candidatus Ratteibacteria TaxID=2979319 RepID=A0A2M7EAD3_9BACT|nr:MAG: hypothetical protein COS11_00710 [bacterium (Candidatus Ratteibacteria) CG01_land_8_20_14_3_00_40_19]PIX76554.1 MAG: hypothetical protein COZ37_07270 [bacterium (Candidatus Ratteibacteria) CG_4_10_14_3_um_filter_41_18]PJA62540.1 MAG: hypothetical protein CO162_00510 [bacterium (Candidatus Ratteibacteria) CG_4_9_14_3_um_filter_41_21]
MNIEMNREKEIFYLSTNGDDLFTGKLSTTNKNRTDGPFKTITKVRDTIRELKKKNGLKKPITVMLRKGTYFLDQTIVFTPEDSGTEGCPITYMAYPGEKVVISGGKKTEEKWRKYNENIWMINIPEIKKEKIYFRQVWINGKRRFRARCQLAP